MRNASSPTTSAAEPPTGSTVVGICQSGLAVAVFSHAVSPMSVGRPAGSFHWSASTRSRSTQLAAMKFAVARFFALVLASSVAFCIATTPVAPVPRIASAIMTSITV